MKCTIDDRPACPETEGWSTPLCSVCHWAMGSPERCPHFGATYGIAAEVLRSGITRNAHPEAQAYIQHIHPVSAHG